MSKQQQKQALQVQVQGEQKQLQQASLQKLYQRPQILLTQGSFQALDPREQVLVPIPVPVLSIVETFQGLLGLGGCLLVSVQTVVQLEILFLFLSYFPRGLLISFQSILQVVEPLSNKLLYRVTIIYRLYTSFQQQIYNLPKEFLEYFLDSVLNQRLQHAKEFLIQGFLYLFYYAFYYYRDSLLYSNKASRLIVQSLQGMLSQSMLLLVASKGRSST